jgi:predicted nucleic acid-binding protein
MRIIVSDSSCLIDLRKTSLLDVFLRLPYEILIPNTLFEDELLKFTAEQKKALLRAGLQVMDLPGDRVLRAQEVVHTLPRLSIHDGFAFALAEGHPGCILLTGDDWLRQFAVQHHIEVHGVLWVIDEIYRNALNTPAQLVLALRFLAVDSTVRLPRRLLSTYIRQYENLD